MEEGCSLGEQGLKLEGLHFIIILLNNKMLSNKKQLMEDTVTFEINEDDEDLSVMASSDQKEEKEIKP